MSYKFRIYLINTITNITQVSTPTHMHMHKFLTFSISSISLRSNFTKNLTRPFNSARSEATLFQLNLPHSFLTSSNHLLLVHLIHLQTPVKNLFRPPLVFQSDCMLNPIPFYSSNTFGIYPSDRIIPLSIYHVFNIFLLSLPYSSLSFLMSISAYMAPHYLKSMSRICCFFF